MAVKDMAMTESSGVGESQLKRSNSIFESSKSKKLNSFPWLVVWTILCNAFTFGISVLFIALYFNADCSTSIAFLFIYSLIFICNTCFGFFFHFKFKRNWVFSDRKRNIIWCSFLFFIAISITIFIISIFIKDDRTCYKRSQLSSLVRANGIIDLVFLGGLTFFNIVTLCSFSTEKRKRNRQPDLELHEQYNKQQAEQNSNNYKSNDNINNYPIPPPRNNNLPQQYNDSQNYNYNNNNTSNINNNNLPPLPPLPHARDNI